MSPLAIGLGLLLGLGVLLGWNGLRRMIDKSLDEGARRRGFWLFNAGLVLIAVSMIAFRRLGAG